MNLMPMETDPEECQVINKLFIQELMNGNQNILVNDQLKEKSKQILVAMNNKLNNNPELEILDDSGAQLLRTALAN